MNLKIAVKLKKMDLELTIKMIWNLCQIHPMQYVNPWEKN